ncbi:hypothetical protein EJ05DRAFT_503632 [Pseudovirgaria hyperparasitica]|uniref:NmrA-like domain-containing protein n=1 Tax=Pseudovirgaria hyperparasitica TaxID=470096 RepID=A0A6A6VYD9_9PEZI|nr:uncharacterized protein EJ05DRAFT_503632 [Pseudovirgaria hyperparasitica]KAF2754680.1 hypothetical protein EJ05DRAFT_503632 [Pseudovirgaria hyperparasitica]
MLILVVGATGNLGQLLAQAALDRGHRVRALGRSPDKLSASLATQLESFVRSENYYDIPALDRACHSVDAIIVAYQGIPTLQLEGQLLLLRSAERAGVKRFVSTSWNYDWRNTSLGQQDSYDAYISFRRHVELSSSIKPIYIFTGVLAEVLFSVDGHGDFSPRNHGVWDPVAKSIAMYGTGEETWPDFGTYNPNPCKLNLLKYSNREYKLNLRLKNDCQDSTILIRLALGLYPIVYAEVWTWHWTTESDAAELTLEILGTEGVEEGGFWTVYSGEHTLPQIATIYEQVRGTKVTIDRLGSVEDLRRTALEARAAGNPQNYWEYIGYLYQLYTLDRTWTLGNADYEKIPNFKPTTLEDSLVVTRKYNGLTSVEFFHVQESLLTRIP